MKKLLVAVAAMTLVAMSASATAIKWSSDALAFGTTSLKQNTTVETYLVYLGSGDWNDPYTMTESMSAGTFGTVADSLTGLSKASKAAKTSQITVANGEVYGLVFKFVSDGKTYWNLSTGFNTVAGLDPTDPTIAPADWTNFAVVSTVKGEAETISAGDGWVTFKSTPVPPPVPEPTTYALIGVAAAALALRKRFMKK